MATGNATLADDGALAEGCPVPSAPLSPLMRALGVALFSLATSYYLATLLWWFTRRRGYQLRKRQGTLMTLSAFGGWVQVVEAALFGFAGHAAIPCQLFYFVTYLILPLVSGPVVVRVLLFYNECAWHRLLLSDYGLGLRAGEINRSNNMQLICSLIRSRDTATRLLVRTRKVYGFTLLALFVATGALAAVVTNYGPGRVPYRCRGCDFNKRDAVVISVFLAAVIFVGVVTLASVRREPDPLGIIKELSLALCLGGVPALVGILLSVVDPGQLRARGQVEWLYLISLGVLILHSVQCPMQVRKTFRKKGWRNIAGKDVTLNEVLATRRGQHFMREYLATEFSLENIYFVQAVARFEAGPTADAAEDVRATFLRPGSLLEVNISDRQKKEYGRNAPQAGPSGISRLTFYCSL